MAFPPPIRITAPLLALAVGLLATWFEYQLNLDLDLARHLKTLRQRAESNSRRLARLSEYLLSRSHFDTLEADIEAITELPQLEIAGVVDGEGRVLADSSGTLRGMPVKETPLASAARLVAPEEGKEFQYGEDERTLLIARRFRLGAGGTGWVLLQFDRAEAIAATRADARTQLAWMAAAMALLSFVLWAVLHFGFAARLGRLADSVRAFGEGRDFVGTLPGGSDEVGKVSAAFEAMAAKLRERENEQARLEREVLGISESVRRRIGRDLHDGLGQRLTAASMTANSLISAAKIEAPPLAERAEEIGRQLRKAITEVRSLSHGLAPVALVEEGFMEALHFRMSRAGAHHRRGSCGATLPNRAGSREQCNQARSAIGNPDRT
jgi:signal transduction histidine kinase